MGELISRVEVRLIDAAVLEKHLINIANTMQDAGFESYAGAMGEAAAIVHSRPTVDAVEVVRCKDCQYMLPLPEDRAPYYGDWVKVCALGRGDLNKGQSVVWPDDFCSEGVRRR